MAAKGTAAIDASAFFTLFDQVLGAETPELRQAKLTELDALDVKAYANMPDPSDAQKRTALQKAVSIPCPQAVEWLFKHGAQLSFEQFSFHNAIDLLRDLYQKPSVVADEKSNLMAAESRDKTLELFLVRLIESSGSSVANSRQFSEAVAQNKFVPVLEAAIAARHLEGVTRLLTSPLIPSFQKRALATQHLITAVDKEDAQLAKVLIDSGASMEKVNLRTAVAKGNADLVAVFLAKADAAEITRDGEELLSIAAAQRGPQSVAIMRQLLERGVSAAMRVPYSYVPLPRRSARSVSGPIQTQRPLLISVIKQGDPAKVALLLEFKADVNARDGFVQDGEGEYGPRTAVHCAVLKGDPKILKQVLDAKPTIGSHQSYAVRRPGPYDDYDKKLLILDVFKMGDAALLKQFVALGGDLEGLLKSNPNDVIDVLAKASAETIRSFIEEKLIPVDLQDLNQHRTLLTAAIMHQNAAAVTVLLEHKASVESRPFEESYGRGTNDCCITALHVAAKHWTLRTPEDEKAFDQLCAASVGKLNDTRYSGFDGDTPLTVAVREQNVTVVKSLSMHLKQQGLSLNVRNPGSSGFGTAVHWAAQIGNEEILRTLREAGANFNLYNGKTPLEVARCHAHQRGHIPLLEEWKAADDQQSLQKQNEALQQEVARLKAELAALRLGQGAAPAPESKAEVAAISGGSAAAKLVPTGFDASGLFAALPVVRERDAEPAAVAAPVAAAAERVVEVPAAAL